jgi:Rrf2 family transcriptional regulator, nitric oxide-sensitive transcriptional repressor
MPMRLTSHTDYALRTLIYLALSGRDWTPVGEIAAAYGISKHHLLKVAGHLATCGYIETIRGSGGGIRLAHPPAEINIGHVVRHTESDMNLVECFCPPEHGQESGCRIEPGCVLRSALRSALDAFLTVLDRYSLHDLLGPQSRLKQLLGLPTIHS